ncbi:MAG: energy transducer TonB [Gammaproteobacteria bacterium]|nr:MAG: energy transducer TonB [Gammaproteobacteria bacterium]
MHAITAPPTVESADRLGFTLFIAIVAHAIVVLGVTFAPEERPRELVSTLDIVLVQNRSEAEPEDVDYLAQANQDGGGESEEAERPATPLRAPFVGPIPDIAMASPPIPFREEVLSTALEPVEAITAAEDITPSAPPTPVLTQERVETAEKFASKPSIEPAPERDTRTLSEAMDRPEPQPEPRAQPETPPLTTQALSAATLISRSLAMASLSAEIDRRLQAYAKRPKRKWITARTKEHKYAAYMDAWRQKVERVGNLNYPDEARRANLSGNLLLDVALRPDGSVDEIILRRSSGEKALDDAAIRIVNLAAPFARFPRNIAEDVDILHVERTWQFLSGNRFASR